MHRVPASRIRSLNAGPLNPRGEHVLYWMVGQRRLGWNFALDRAIEHCRALGKPLFVLEALRVGYRWASDRMHRFILDGMADNAALLEKAGVAHFSYVEPEVGAGAGLVSALADCACVVVTDDFPSFFLPRMLDAAAKQVPVQLEAVDSNGLYPMRDTPRSFPTAHAFRRHLHKALPPFLEEKPAAHPLASLELPRHPGLPRGLLAGWPAASSAILTGDLQALGKLPIDHGVRPSVLRGGHGEGQRLLRDFIDRKLDGYGGGRNDPDADASSGFSPYLHFGYLSAHEVFAAVCAHEGWTPAKLGKPTGSREGFWGMSPSAEGFLDELITWRELGYNFSALRTDVDQYASLPPWARATLEKHASDPRPHLYDFDTLAQGRTADRIWNAAQQQLVQEGRMHNYLRMLWGKKVLEWSETPQQAIETLIELNNRYALDGRNPNSYSGIFWVFGRYDRAWGPERPIYGTIRYMSSENTARKLSLKKYLGLFAPVGSAQAAGAIK